MQKMVFIASLHRSGSTVLELILRNFPEHVNLGEVSSFILNLNNADKKICECGNTAEDCEFWGPTVRQMKRNDTKDLTDRYRELIKQFQKHFGKKSIIVDSSKVLRAIEALKNIPDLDLKVIYLVRDVRAWVTSIMKFSARNKRVGSIKHFIRWYRGNLRIQNFLIKNNIKYFQIGYEELTLYPFISLTQIAEYLNTIYSDSILSLQNSKGHNIGGNRMRNDPKKREKIIYDSRWLYNHKYWLLPMILFPNILNFNTRNVYGNIVLPFQS